MAGRQHGDQRLLDQKLEGDAGRLRFSRRRNATSTLPRISAPASRATTGSPSVISIPGSSPRRMRSASGSHTISCPVEKADHERALFGLRRAARRFARRFDLQQRQPRMIEKDAARRGERDATRAALQQLDADLQFEIADLPA